MQLILAGTAFGQTWHGQAGGAGPWGTASNWTPDTVPNSPSATAIFNAVNNNVFFVSLSGGPFTVGTLNLNNDNTGGFFFQNGTLQLAGPATINVESKSSLDPDFDTSATIVLQANATINTVFADSTLTVDGTITSNSFFGLTKIGPGTLTLTGNSTYKGDTNVNGGTLIIQNGGKVSDREGTIATNSGTSGTVTVTGAGSTWTNSADLIVAALGPGTLTIQNGGKVSDLAGVIGDQSGSSGTVTVSGAGSTWTNSGSLFVGGNSSGPAGVGLLQITNGGTVNAAATTIWNTGALAIGGSFTLNSPLTINGGTVRTLSNTTFPNNATLGAGGVVLDSNGFDSTFSGAFSGAGGITKINAGTVTLTGNNTYSGGSIIQEGTLVAGTAGGAQAISFALGTGGVFLQGGTLRTPSLDPLVINVGGNYVQGPGGTLALGVAGVNGVQYDRLLVQGSATLNGTLAVNSLNNFHPSNGDAFEVVRTGKGLTGEFAQVSDSLNNNPNLQRIDVYAPNGVALVYVAAAPIPTPTPGPQPTPTPGPQPTPTPGPQPNASAQSDAQTAYYRYHPRSAPTGRTKRPFVAFILTFDSQSDCGTVNVSL